jgi:hypothetical protein
MDQEPRQEEEERGKSVMEEEASSPPRIDVSLYGVEKKGVLLHAVPKAWLFT